MERGELKSEKHLWNLLGRKYNEKTGSDAGAVVILPHKEYLMAKSLLPPAQNSLGSGGWEPPSIRDPQVWSGKDTQVRWGWES